MSSSVTSFQVELRDEEEGTRISFDSIDRLLEYFFNSHIIHRGKRLLPVDFRLFVNDREYGWDKKCQMPVVVRTARQAVHGNLNQLREEIRKHLLYIADLEDAFYDEPVNISYEEDVPTDS